MIAVIQRVTHAAVHVDGEQIAAIDKGFLILLGVLKNDDTADAQKLADKIAKLRAFEDAAGKMNLDLAQTGARVLAVSQFTLAADTTKGNRPGFDPAMPPEQALALFNCFVARLREKGVDTQTGRFGAHMRVSLANDGPVTFVINSADL